MATNIYQPTDSTGAVCKIASGASLSQAIILNGTGLFTIVMPAAWTAAGLSFQGSVDGTTFGDLYDASGAEVTIPASAVIASACIVLPAGAMDGLQAIKVRSGTTGTPVTQGADRTITLGARRFF